MTSRKPVASFWIVVAVAVLLVYTISIGPAAWIINHSAPTVTGILIVPYIPLIAAANAAGPTQNALDWYTGLWADAKFRLTD